MSGMNNQIDNLSMPSVTNQETDTDKRALLITIRFTNSSADNAKRLCDAALPQIEFLCVFLSHKDNLVRTNWSVDSNYVFLVHHWTTPGATTELPCGYPARLGNSILSR